jgi:hypothetical protein
MNDMQFMETYCSKCGTQRCKGIDSEWFEGCKYRWNHDSYDAAAEIERLNCKIMDLAREMIEMKDNNQILAEKIYEIENAPRKQANEWLRNNITQWKITDKIYIEASNDHMCWYLWKYDDGKCEYGFFKVIPKVHCDKKTIEAILNAQQWVWI